MSTLYKLWILALISDGKTQSCSSREPGAAGPAALLRPQHGVWAHWNAGGAGAFVWGALGSRGHRGVSLRAQAVPVYPRPSATDLLLRDAVWDRHRCRRMLPIKGGPRCVWVCVYVWRNVQHWLVKLGLQRLLSYVWSSSFHMTIWNVTNWCGFKLWLQYCI